MPRVLWSCNLISEYIVVDGAWVMAHAFIIATYKMRLCTFDETFFLFHCGFSVFVRCTLLTKKRKHCILLMVCVRNILKRLSWTYNYEYGCGYVTFLCELFWNISFFNHNTWIIIFDNIFDILQNMRWPIRFYLECDIYILVNTFSNEV